MTEPHILVVDDARDIREPLGQYLRRHGFRTSLAAGAAEARDAVEGGAVDLVVLDVMMPGEDGLSVCRWLVGRGGPPVILLTAMSDDTDRIVGLELGADDYVVKPFNPRELLARIRAVLRRAPPAAPSVPSGRRRFAGWTFDPAARALAHDDGRVAELTSGEARLLGAFLDRPRAVLSRDRLLDLTAGRDAKAYDRAIDNQVSRLRRKVEADPARPSLIVTEWGGGYALAADVEDADAGEAR
jgi:two-component system OmpR family response regulator